MECAKFGGSIFFNQLLISMSLYQHAESGFFIILFYRYSWFKNPVIWLAKSILAYTSGTRLFPNLGFVQEYSK